jgi:hypothetical protein
MPLEKIEQPAVEIFPATEHGVSETDIDLSRRAQITAQGYD